MWTRSIILCLGTAIATPAWAQEDRAPTADAGEVLEQPVPAGSRDIYFDADLMVDQDLMLEGVTATETVNFRVPERWDLTQDPVLHLKFNHSQSLVPRRSVLTVWVNGNGAGSVRLNEDNVRDGYIKVRLPRTSFFDEGYNDVQFRVVQHLDDECEDPFDPALWTRVQLDSFIRFHYRNAPLDTDLLKFPAPYFDARGYGPMEVSLAGIGKASNAQLDALAILGFAFGRHTSYRGVATRGPLQSADQATTPVLVVGTPNDNPLVAQYVDTSSLKAGVGTIASLPNPSNPSTGVLVVTGGDAAGLIKAAEALASQDRYQALSGSIASVSDIRDPFPPPTQRTPLPVPDRASGEGVRFPLSAMKVPDITVRGYYSPPVRIPLKMEGDAEVHIDGARVGIDYAYSSGLDTRLSTMEVRLDDVTLRSVALNEATGEEKTRLWVDLPWELLKPDAELEVVFHLFPLNFDPCVYVTDKHIWGTIFASTELRIARDGYTELPDLGKLRYDMWPLNAAVDGRNGLLVVAPDDATGWDASSVFQTMAQLGTVSTGETPEFNVVKGGGGLADEAGRDMLVLVGSGKNSTYSQLRDSGALSQQGDDLDVLIDGVGERVLKAQVGTPYGTVEQALIDKTGIGRTAIVLKAQSSDRLLQLVHRMSDPAVVSGMTGNLVVVGSGREVRSLDVAEKHAVGTRSTLSTLRRVLQASWAALVLGVIAAAILLALLVRAWAARRGGQT